MREFIEADAQPIVATDRGMSTAERESRVKRIIEENYTGVTPKTIASKTAYSEHKLNYNTVKSICRRLLGRQEIQEHPKHKGWYVPVEKSTHSMFELNVQNLILTYQLKENENITKRISNMVEQVGTVRFCFGVGYKSKMATMHISTDYPFNLTSLPLCVKVFKDLMEKNLGIAGISDKEVLIRTTEVNKDVYGVRIDGASAITVDGIMAQLKIYQKQKEKVRVEYKTKLPINAETITSLLCGSLNSADQYTQIKLLTCRMENMERIVIKQNKLMQSWFLAVSKIKTSPGYFE